MSSFGLFGPPDVGRLKANQDLQGLIKALGYQKDERIRKSAAKALGELKIKEAVEPLITALKKGPWDVSQTAAEALGQIGDARAVETLIDALKGKDTCHAAAVALGQIGDTRAVEPLIAALNHEESIVRRGAAQSLGEIGDARAVGPLIAVAKNGDKHIREAVSKALGQIGAPAVEPLIVALATGNLLERCIAATGLGQTGDFRAVEPLVAALHSLGENIPRASAEEIRGAAADSLDKLGWQPDQGADGAMYWIIRNGFDRCVQIGAPAVEPLIVELKKGSGKQTRNMAARVLGEIGDARAVEPLIAALENALKDQKYPEGAFFIKALGEIGDPRAVEPLITVLNLGRRHFDTPAMHDQVNHIRMADLGERGLHRAAAEALRKLGLQPEQGGDEASS
jgi:HEAT repeat protein